MHSSKKSTAAPGSGRIRPHTDGQPRSNGAARRGRNKSRSAPCCNPRRPARAPMFARRRRSTSLGRCFSADRRAAGPRATKRTSRGSSGAAGRRRRSRHRVAARRCPSTRPCRQRLRCPRRSVVPLRWTRRRRPIGHLRRSCHRCLGRLPHRPILRTRCPRSAHASVGSADPIVDESEHRQMRGFGGDGLGGWVARLRRKRRPARPHCRGERDAIERRAAEIGRLIVVDDRARYGEGGSARAHLKDGTERARRPSLEFLDGEAHARRERARADDQLEHAVGRADHATRSADLGADPTAMHRRRPGRPRSPRWRCIRTRTRRCDRRAARGSSSCRCRPCRYPRRPPRRRRRRTAGRRTPCRPRSRSP